MSWYDRNDPVYEDKSDWDCHDEEEIRFSINVCAEDSFGFYVKTDKDPDEIVNLIFKAGDEKSWINTSDEICTSRLNDEWMFIEVGLIPQIDFEAVFRDKDGEWFDSYSNKKDSVKPADISDVIYTIRQVLGEAVSDIKLCSDPGEKGLSFSIADDGGLGDSFLEKKMKNFEKDYLLAGDPKYYLEKEFEDELWNNLKEKEMD